MTQDELSGLSIDKRAFSSGRGSGRRIWWIIVLVAATAGGLSAWRAGWLTPAREVQVAAVSRVYPAQTFTLLNASGYVVAQRKASVASKLTSRLDEIMVEEGNRVKAGQIIARLENADFAAAVERTKAQLESAQFALAQAKADHYEAALDYGRKGDLVSKQVISRAEFDAADARHRATQAAVAAREAEVRSSRAALEEAEVNLEYTFLRAPFDAVVLTKNADVGDIITPIGAAAEARAAVVDIADMASLMVEADVSESSIGKVRPAQPCEIRLDSLPEERFPARVHMIVPTADRSKASVMVKVAFEKLDERVLPEMSAKVAFLSRAPGEDEREAFTAVPAAALVGDAVFVVQGGKAVRARVEAGRRFDDVVEVLSGVQPGERVVLTPSPEMKDGDPVKVPGT